MIAIGCLFEGKIKEHIKKHYGKYALGAGAAILGGPELAARATEHSAGEGVSDEAAKLAIKALKEKDIDPNSAEGKLAINAAKKVAKTASIESFRGSGTTSEDVDKTINRGKNDIADSFENNKKAIDVSHEQRIKHIKLMHDEQRNKPPIFSNKDDEPTRLSKIEKSERDMIAAAEADRKLHHGRNLESKEELDKIAEKGRSVGRKLAGGEDIREKLSIPRRIKRALEK